MTQPRQVLAARLDRFAFSSSSVSSLLAPALAQTGTAALVGEVTDAQKQVLPGATVTVTHVATAASQTTITDERGSFRLSNVQPGLYTR